jgi:predicted DNA-binding mobile mystery protein A
MSTREAVRGSRRRLDERLAALQPAGQYATPRSGWVRAIREALGMSLNDLGARMGVSAQTVQSLEKSEQADRAQLATLRRAAAAMDCSLVYAFVPNSSLQQTVQTQAELIFDIQAGSAMHTMALEDQAAELPASARRAIVDKLVEGGRLWSRS